MDLVTLRAGATLGPNGVILPAAALGNHATVGPMSLVMRGESVPDRTRWIGNPIGPWVDDEAAAGERDISDAVTSTSTSPSTGDPSYDVNHYELAHRLQGRVQPARRGVRVLDAVATTEVDTLQIDLQGLRVSKVTLDACRRPRSLAPGQSKLVVRRRPLAAGEKFRLTVNTRGALSRFRMATRATGWEELTDGVIVAGQPHGAPSWFPCNDRPSNKASYRMVVTARLRLPRRSPTVPWPRRRVGASATTWMYKQSEPMATYLATVQIGRYEHRTGPTAPVPDAGGHARAAAREVRRRVRRQPRDVARSSPTSSGPTRSRRYTVVITDDELDIPLEAQGVSVFGANFLELGLGLVSASSPTSWHISGSATA